MTHATIPAETRAALGIGDAGPAVGRRRGRRGPARRPAPGAGADLGAAARLGPARSSRGEQPKRARNARLKCAASLKPHANAMSLTLRAAQRRVAQVAPGPRRAAAPRSSREASTARRPRRGAACSARAAARAAIAATLSPGRAAARARSALICSRWQRGELRHRRPARRRQRGQAGDQDVGHAVGHRRRGFGREHVDVGGQRADHVDHQVAGAAVAADRAWRSAARASRSACAASGRAASARYCWKGPSKVSSYGRVLS